MHRRVDMLDPKLRKFLHYISLTGSFMMTYGFIYMVLKYTIGQITFIKDAVLFGNMPLAVPLFSLTTVLIVIKFIRFSSPYQK